jgi:amino acid transporter
MLTFISFWRAASIVLCDLGSSAFYAGGIAEEAVGAAAPWFILGIMLFSFAVRAVYVESCSMFTRGGVYRVVKEALGGTFAKLSVSALMFDYILTGPISGVSAGQYITGLMNELMTVANTSHWLPPALIDAHNNPIQFNMNYTSAVFAAVVTIYYWWQNIKGIEESSHKAMQVMQITTIMVVIMLIWGIYSVFMKGAQLPPPPTVANLKFSDDALGFLRGTRLVPVLGLFGILMAFGHSLLAMSGEESLAQVNREIEHPKLKNLKRAAIVIAIYSLIFTGGATILASMLIPMKDHVMYQDNLIAGLAMNLVGPMFWRIAFRIFVVLVGFLILSGAINTSMIGSTGVLMRVAEDGVLTDWFRKPHHKFGTSSRIVNLVFILQMVTIIASRGNVIMLGEAYAFGVIWSFTFNSLAMLVLRWKYHGERGWKVPPNIRIGKTEVPVGLISVFLVLLSTAIVNLFTKSVATVSGVVFAAAFFIIFTIESAQACDYGAADEGPLSAGASGHDQPRVGGATARWNHGDDARSIESVCAEVDAFKNQHRRPGRGCDQRAHDGRGRTGVSERGRYKFQRARADGVYQGRVRCGKLWQEGFTAGGAGGRCVCGAGAGRELTGSGVSGFQRVVEDDGGGPGIPHGTGVGSAAGTEAAIQFLCDRSGGLDQGVLYWAACAEPEPRRCAAGAQAVAEHAARSDDAGPASQRHYYVCIDAAGGTVCAGEAGDYSRPEELSRGGIACGDAVGRAGTGDYSAGDKGFAAA